MLEEFGKISSAVAFPIFECLVGPIKAVQRFGTDEMKERLLPGKHFPQLHPQLYPSL